MQAPTYRKSGFMRPNSLAILVVLFVMGLAVAAQFYPTRSESKSAARVKASNSEISTPVVTRYSRWNTARMFGLPVQETIDTFASDCTTPRTVFYVGETVCAKTNSVDLNYPGGRWVDWILTGPTTIVSGSRTTTLITTNPQTFSYAPTATGTYKVEITQDLNGQDDPQTPAIFTVVDTPPIATWGYSTSTNSCTFPKTDFVLGETVCVKVESLAVNSTFPNKIAWTDTDGLVRSKTDLISDPQTDTFQLPASASSLVFGGITVDNRGTWRVSSTRNNARRINTAEFTVSDPQQAVADIFVQKTVRSGDVPISSGGLVAVVIVVGNQGPNTATNVMLADSTPVGSTLTSFTQQSGPSCTPANTGNCTIASLDNGDRAEFTAVYDTGATAAGTHLTSASVSGTQLDSKPDNNSASAQFEVAAGGGGSQCSLVCPTSLAPVNNAPGQNGATVDWDGPNNDNVAQTSGTCGAVSYSTTSPHFFSIGVTPITATTESGESCTFTVTVVDNENPVIGNCPSNITVTEDTNTPGSAVVNYQTPSATDNSGSATVTCDSPSGSSFTVSGSPHTVTCTATDDAGNTDSCSFTVSVNASNPNCTLTPPANVTANADANQCGTNVTYQEPTQSGSCGTVTCDHPSGSFFGVGTTTVTCNDSAGASTSFTVTVNDTTAPVPNVNPLPTLTGDCSVTAGVPVVIDPPGPEPPHTVIELPRATDNCNGSISASTEDERTYTQAGTYVVTWTYTDSSGNTTTQQQTVTVTGNDTAAPVPDVTTLPTITGECEATITGAPTATDDCTGTVTGTTTDALTYVGAGTYTVHWIYTDNVGHTSTQNQTVVVTDTHAPTISCPANISVNNDPGMCFATVNPGTATATDNCAINLTTVVGTRSDNQPLQASYPVGTTTITWTATDSGNNTASCVQTVTVNDVENPIISCQASITVPNDAGLCGAVVTYTTPVGQDNCAGATTTQTSGLPSGSTFPVGITTNTFVVTDAHGHSASCSFTVTVNDAENPVITCPSSQVLEPTCPSGAIGNWTAPVGTDNCPGAVTTRTAGPAPGSTFAAGTSTTITYTVNDAHGHSASCSFTITVKTVLQTLDDLRASVAANTQLNGTQRNGLLAKLDAAKQHIQNNNQNGACSKLSDFVNSVQNFIDHGDLSATTGNAWNSTANHIRNAIGCTNNPCS